MFIVSRWARRPSDVAPLRVAIEEGWGLHCVFDTRYSESRRSKLTVDRVSLGWNVPRWAPRLDGSGCADLRGCEMVGEAIHERWDRFGEKFWEANREGDESCSGFGVGVLMGVVRPESIVSPVFSLIVVFLGISGIFLAAGGCSSFGPSPLCPAEEIMQRGGRREGEKSVELAEDDWMRVGFLCCKFFLGIRLRFERGVDGRAVGNGFETNKSALRFMHQILGLRLDGFQESVKIVE